MPSDLGVVVMRRVMASLCHICDVGLSGPVRVAAWIREEGRSSPHRSAATSSAGAVWVIVTSGGRRRRAWCRGCFGDALSDGCESDRVAAGGQPGERLLHRHRSLYFGGGAQLVGRNRKLSGAVGGPARGSRHSTTRPLQGSRIRRRHTRARASPRRRSDHEDRNGVTRNRWGYFVPTPMLSGAVSTAGPLPPERSRSIPSSTCRRTRPCVDAVVDPANEVRRRREPLQILELQMRVTAMPSPHCSSRSPFRARTEPRPYRLLAALMQREAHRQVAGHLWVQPDRSTSRSCRGSVKPRQSSWQTGSVCQHLPRVAPAPGVVFDTWGPDLVHGSPAYPDSRRRPRHPRQPPAADRLAARDDRTGRCVRVWVLHVGGGQRRESGP